MNLSEQKVPVDFSVRIGSSSWILIDLEQLRKNFFEVRRLFAPVKVCLPVKANGYGHGLVEVARIASQSGIDSLAVAHLEEGIALRKGGITLPILVLGALSPFSIEPLLEYDLTPTVQTPALVDGLEHQAKEQKKRVGVHIEVETGIQRTGVSLQEAFALFSHIEQKTHLFLEGVYTHFPKADRPEDPHTIAQIETMLDLQQKYPNPHITWHMANSAGALYYPSSRAHMVRPGLFAYSALAPAFSVHARVSYVKTVPPSTGISYGHRYYTTQKTNIVTLPIGYGDGYRRIFGQEVLLRGKRYPIVGAICMDQCMVDVGREEIQVGEEAVLLGRQGAEEISLEEIATKWQTIPYEVLCAFQPRIPRVYVGCEN